jgi:hypothetical protein
VRKRKKNSLFYLVVLTTMFFCFSLLFSGCPLPTAEVKDKITKPDPDPNPPAISIAWSGCLGGNWDDNVRSFIQTADNGHILAGYTGSIDGDFSGNHGGGDTWVAKLDASFDVSWQKCLGGSAFDTVYSVQQTLDTGYILAGRTDSTNDDVTGNHGGSDAWVVKLDSDGDIDWQRCLGGSADDVVSSIEQISDTEYIVAGITESNDGDVAGANNSMHIGFNVWCEDAWLVKVELIY